MVKNQRGGKKYKRGKKLGEDTANKNVELAENGQEYAKVLARLGGARIEVECTDGKKRQAIIPGKFKKKIWMNPGDIVLVSVDAVGNDEVCSVDKKYSPKDVVTLRQKGLINFEEDEVDSKNYEFKSTEDNIGRVHPNVREQRNIPSLDSDESDSDDSYNPSAQYLEPNRFKRVDNHKSELSKGPSSSSPESSEENPKSSVKQTESESESSEENKEKEYTLDDL
jgi:translation initiation factor 1A